MGDEKNFNKAFLAYILIGLVIFLIPMLMQTGVLDITTRIGITSTDNSVVQSMTRVSKIFQDTRFEYYSLPCNMEQFGNKFEIQLWFQERYQVNGTYETFEHGPFTVSFNTWSFGESIIVELNQENVTITCTG